MVAGSPTGRAAGARSVERRNSARDEVRQTCCDPDGWMRYWAMNKNRWAVLLASIGLMIGAAIGVWVWNGRSASSAPLDRFTVGGFVLGELGTILTTIGLVFAVQEYSRKRVVTALASSGGEAVAAGGNVGKAADARVAKYGRSSPEHDETSVTQVTSKAHGLGSSARAAGGDISD
jgi:hypothetical protein